MGVGGGVWGVSTPSRGKKKLRLMVRG